MKLDAVGVTSSNLKRTASFYSLLGFKFPEFKDNEQHLEPVASEGSARLMLDTKELIADMFGKELTKINPKETYKFLESTDSGWYKISLSDGQEGWISGKYAKLFR